MNFFSDTDEAKDILRNEGLRITGLLGRNPVRAVEEIYKMEVNTQAQLDQEGDNLVWSEWIVNDFGNLFLISIKVGSGYPYVMPKAFVLEPEILPGTPHFFVDSSLCLMHKDDYSSRMSILDIRNLACAWCWCYDVYRQTGEWPAAERPH